jgi:hypothetical protein
MINWDEKRLSIKDSDLRLLIGNLMVEANVNATNIEL